LKEKEIRGVSPTCVTQLWRKEGKEEQSEKKEKFEEKWHGDYARPEADQLGQNCCGNSR
jgi:hypothetical protein